MRQAVNVITKVMEIAIVVLLASMAVMVFVNVVLRYGFNSSIVMSEEMSRFLFVWLTFIGAVLAFKENGHLGVETLVKLFGRKGRVICMGLTNALILICVTILFWGTWLQTPINASTSAPVSGMPMILVFGISYFTATGMGLISAYRLILILTGRITDTEIALFVGEYDDVDALIGRGE